MTRPPRPRPEYAHPAGAAGEDLAAAGLRRAGYRIVGRNVRTKAGEIDLLVRRGRCWIAVEVKSRTGHPAPERTVRGEQLDRLAGVLRALAPRLRPRPRDLWIDAVSVRWLSSGPEILHFPALRHVTWNADGIGGCGCRPAPRDRRPNMLPTVPVPAATPTMPVLSDQIMPRRKLLLILSETILFSAVVLIGTSLPPLTTRSYPFFAPNVDLLRGLLTSFTVAAICQTSLSYNDLYDWKSSQNRAELPNRLLHAAGYALVMLGMLSMAAGSLFFLPGLADINRETWKLILLVGIAFVGVYLFRNAFHWFFYKWRFGERIVVVGSSTEAQQIAYMVMESPMTGFELLGIVEEPGQPPLPQGVGHPRVLGTLDQLRDLCRDEGISRVVVALRERRGKVPVDRLLDVRMAGVLVEERETMYERLAGKLAVESMRPSYLIYGRGFAKSRLTTVSKRALDVAAAASGLVLSLPLSLLAALLIKLTSRGPVFFCQE
ncbi:MAG: hypothetical protein FJ306_12550, partial [Planctomycetes bacterium]|nr:hypothetical protein [Planctomycetota bacterium]